MNRLRSLNSVKVSLGVVALLAAGCGETDDRQQNATTTMSTGIGDSATTGTTSGGTDDSGGETTDSGDGPRLDAQINPTGGSGCSDGTCTGKIDILFVVDNSGTMADEQLNLARNFPLLVQQLLDLEDSQGNTLAADVNIMVTTTDMGNSLCGTVGGKAPTPERGAPVSTGCNARIDNFTGLAAQGQTPDVREEACTSVCPVDVVPNGNFIHFEGGGVDNLPDVPDADINGDGMPDGAIAQALACVGMQGIDGCGYESPLEAMVQSLADSQPWNQGADPFLRDDALLAIVMITDEADCSVKNFDIMTDPNFQNDRPSDGTPQPSSAICWNAGVNCVDTNMDGVYESCEARDDGNLHETSRYIGFLDFLKGQGKDVIMLGVLGVPEVTMRADEPPFQPTAGGVMDLVFRDWTDGVFPAGDILPDDDAAGRDAAFQQWAFGVGPGCTGQLPSGDFTGQGIPPVRVVDVCESLNEGDDIRCCIESVCDDDFSAAITCLTGAISTAIVPAG